MKVRINNKRIKDRCGTVSYKKGEAFFRNGKVHIIEENDLNIKAIVKGVEEFHVNLEIVNGAEVKATCSCPSLSSFQKDCQHVAAALIALQSKTEQDSFQRSMQSNVSKEILGIFEEKSVQAMGKQQHFEERKILDVTFFCKTVETSDGKSVFGVEMSIHSKRIKDIRRFLTQVHNREKGSISQGFYYDPKEHCFLQEVELVLKQLILVVEDEKMYQRAMMNRNRDPWGKQFLPIPVSSWDRLLTLLQKSPQVILEYDENHYIGIDQTDDTLPLRFEFGDEASGFSLRINGLRKMKVMKEYGVILYNGKIISIDKTDAGRLSELKSMIESTKSNRIPIPPEQLSSYMDRLVPALRRLGEVHVTGSITEKIQKTPLHAKLYLDRLKNRLLLGIEFHYDQIVINPLEKIKLQVGSIIIRDTEKEQEIIRLIEEEAQFNSTESGYYLHNEGLEYHFLYHVLPKLENLVQVYATTAVRNRIFRKKWKPKIKVKHRKERMNWLEFSFDFDGIPENEIKDVLEALEEKRKYYRLKEGTLFSLESREVEEIKRFLHEVPVQEEELEERFHVPVIQGLRLLDKGNEDYLIYDQSFREFIEKIRNPDSDEFQVPEELKHVLRNYQKQGFRWMKTIAQYGFGGILADDMGLGKTVQSIAYILSELPHIRKVKLPILIVCPSSVTYNWLSEMMEFAPEIEAMVIDGKKTERVELYKEKKKMDVLITSYPLLRNDIRMYEKDQFHTVFFDEAQMFKNPLSQTARSVKKINATHRFALTGTPVENALEELWSIFHVVFPQLFSGLKEYSELSKKQIARRIRPFMLRRMKKDVLDELPNKEVQMERTDLYPEQKKLYASYLSKLKHDTFKHLDKDTFQKNRIKILAGITRLRQICCHPSLFVEGYNGRSAKLDQLKKIIDEATYSGRKVLIFSQFTKMLNLIGKELNEKGLPYYYLDGHTPPEQRVTLSNHFNQGDGNFFLISLKAGGTGLNLTSADTVIFYDSWWNPAVEEQATDRAYRMGQTKTVKVLKLVAKGTIEDKMYELQEKKRHLIKEVIDPDDAMLQTLTEEDIRDLLDL